MAGNFAPPPSFQREVVPILRSACLGCHAAPSPAGGFAVESYAELLKGGKNGPAITPGKSGTSRMVQMLAGTVKPQMPPGGALKPADIDVIRRWVDAGAKEDAPTAIGSAAKPAGKTAATAAVSVPHPKAVGVVRNLPAPVQALAFSPYNKLLAIGTYQKVLIADPVTRLVTGTWNGQSDAVRALAFSPDGKWLAAGSGIAGAFGETRLWNAAEGKEINAFGNQTDTVTSLVFTPDGKTLLTGSIDKSIQLWEVATGKPLQTLRDHADAVLGLSLRNDGKYLASCSVDKSVKVWDTATWKRLYTVGAHDEPVTAVSFATGGGTFVTTSTDHYARVWNFAADNSGMARALGGHGSSVLCVAVSPDGKIAATGSGDKSVKLWNIADGANLATLKEPADWVYAVQFSPDGKRLVAGTWNGMVYFWNVETRKLEGTLSTLPLKK